LHDHYKLLNRNSFRIRVPIDAVSCSVILEWSGEVDGAVSLRCRRFNQSWYGKSRTDPAMQEDHGRLPRRIISNNNARDSTSIKKHPAFFTPPGNLVRSFPNRTKLLRRVQRTVRRKSHPRRLVNQDRERETHRSIGVFSVPVI
jgi:hypothetical protein